MVYLCPQSKLFKALRKARLGEIYKGSGTNSGIQKICKGVELFASSRRELTVYSTAATGVLKQ